MDRTMASREMPESRHHFSWGGFSCLDVFSQRKNQKKHVTARAPFQSIH